jgi:hypothetical protein
MRQNVSHIVTERVKHISLFYTINNKLHVTFVSL